MKPLTIEELSNAPGIVQLVYLSSINKTPIGISTYEQALKDYPEYFPQEVKRRKQWVDIPIELRNGYMRECSEHFQSVLGDLESKGILYYCDHPEEHKEFQRKLSTRLELLRIVEKHLWDKYFGDYDIEYNG